MLDSALLLVFPALMAFAAFSDLFTMTISNRISLALVAVFLLLAPATGAGLEAIAWHLSAGLAMLALTFAFFAFGWIGGGDAKLAAATAVWLGWERLLDYGVAASVLGGGLTLALLAIRQHPLPAWGVRRAWLSRLHDKATGVPYGIALAAAGLLVYPQSLLWDLAASAG